jgi:hypothetical protein
MTDKDLPVTTPVVTFIISNCRVTYTMYVTVPDAPNPRYKHNRYAANISIVSETLPFLQQVQVLPKEGWPGIILFCDWLFVQGATWGRPLNKVILQLKQTDMCQIFQYSVLVNTKILLPALQTCKLYK